jgi:ligand-binding SRPBCC domain-containing protein
MREKRTVHIHDLVQDAASAEGDPLRMQTLQGGVRTWLGVPLRWRAFIREWDPPFRFVDVQVRGPYARWEHRHRFLETGDTTCVEDRVTYRLPGGPVGRLLHAVAVGRQLRALWDYRTRRLGALVGPVRPPAEG